MGRYPFTECVNAYIPNEVGHISADTLSSTRRRLMQIGRIFHEMKASGLVSSENPRTITPKDIDIYVGHRKSKGMKSSTILKDLGYLAKLFAYNDNDAITVFRAKYPAHVPKRYQKRQPSMDESLVRRIIERGNTVPPGNWELCEAYSVVILALSTGFRAKEIRMISMDNVHIDGDYAEILAVHVKGEETYGCERWVNVHPDGVPMLKKYIEARRLRLEQAGKTENALFPPLINKGGYISYKRIRILKSIVEKDLQTTFELRKCRRTFGQRALNEGQDLHNVSLVMGHSTLATTQRYYCDKDQHDASREMRDFWQNERKQEVG